MYCTVAELQRIYGDRSLAEATAATSSSSPQDYWEPKLAATAVQIDAVLRQAGYAVPIVFSSLSESDATGVRALLREWNAVLALEIGAPAVIATEKGVNSAADTARANMKQLLAGRMRLPMALVRSTIGSVAGPDAIDSYAPPRLDDSLFARNRHGWERE